jgi:hypothetical protein
MGTTEQLDLGILPEEAKKEIKDFYEFLLTKYGIKVREKNKEEIKSIIPSPVKKFRPLTREEIYAR